MNLPKKVQVRSQLPGGHPGHGGYGVFYPIESRDDIFTKISLQKPIILSIVSASQLDMSIIQIWRLPVQNSPLI